MALRLILLYSLILLLLAAPGFAQQASAVGPFTEVETAVCTSVEDRQPVGTAASFAPEVGQLFFWTKCVGAADSTTITHVWTREGEEMARVDLPVKSSSWRTWSSKQLLPSWTGSWEVRILDAGGNILKSVSFKVEAQAEPPEPVAEEPPAESEEAMEDEGEDPDSL